MAIENKYRVHQFAKDFNLKSKDIIDLISLHFETPKNHMAVLSDAELSYLFEHFSKNGEVESFDKYFSEGLATREEKIAKTTDKGETKVEKATEIKKEDNKETKKTEDTNKNEVSNTPNKKANMKDVNSKEVSEDIAQKVQSPKVRIIDTKEANIDLGKYDEKLEELVPEKAKNFHKNTQKIKKGANKKRLSKAELEKIRIAERDKRLAKKKISLELPEEVMVNELAKLLMITTGEVIKKLMMLGVMANANQVIDFDTAALVAEEFGAKVDKKVEVTIEEQLFDDTLDKDEDLITRDPVVVVMGHVDHGKTSVLDAIRNEKVREGEAGGITQHIGAYRVRVNDKKITFLDTPGHAAFTSMRARGAMATDIAILVVAADDGIMPQTVEAISHAKAAGVSIIVAINKIDKVAANIDKVKTELTEYELVPEEWGGDVICVPVSAMTGENIDTLLEMVLLQAEMAELKANPNKLAVGTVIEARLDKGRGPVASILIKEGTLKTSDFVIAGTTVGKVRVMTDDKGKEIKKAGPSVPVEITGLSDVPEAGEVFRAVENERMAKELAEQRRNIAKEEIFKQNASVSLDDLFNQIKDGVKNLNIIVKADVQGSVEAIKASLEKLSNEEVNVKVIHGAVGAISESDIMLASASNAIVVGFNVRPEVTASSNAKDLGVDVRLYSVIYNCIEEIESAMKGMLAPIYEESILGQAEVRQTFKASGIGTIAGCMVKSGKIVRNAKIRLIRDNIVVFEGELGSLKRFKDDAKEVLEGFECGMNIEKYNDIKEGDIIEAFEMVEVKR